MLLGLATKMESQMNLVMNKASSSHLVHSCYCKELFAIYFFSDMLNGQELRANPVLGIESNMDRARFRQYINGREAQASIPSCSSHCFKKAMLEV